MTALRKDIPTEESAVLIILTGSLGDVTRGLCLVKPLKAFWPNRPLVWLVESKWAGLLKLNPHIDHLVIFNRCVKPSALKTLTRDLRAYRFHTSLDLQRIFKSGVLACLAHAPLRLGFNRKNAKEFNWLFNNQHIPYYPDTLPKLEHYLKFLDYLNVPYPATPDFGLDQTLMAQMLPPAVSSLTAPYAVLAVGSSWPSKNWHAPGYVELAQHLFHTYGLNSVLSGDKSQTGIASAIMQNNPAYITNLTGQTNLPQLAAVLNGAQIAVGPDSGAGHIAAAVGTPYISLFGPTSPRRTAPYGYENLVVQLKLNCAPCYKKNCAHNKCMRQIDLAAINPKIEAALNMRRQSAC